MRRFLQLSGSIVSILLIIFFFGQSDLSTSTKVDGRELILKEKESKQFDRPDLAIQQNNEMTLDPKLGYPPVERSVRAFEQLKQQRSQMRAVLSETNWVERGPNNVGGRTRALLFDPNDPSAKKVWAGGIGGGLWYIDDITDASMSWTNVDDFLTNLAISSIAYDPTDPMTFYVSTGLGYTNDIRGAGIFKSTDGGDSWSQLSSTDNSDFYFIQKIAVDDEGRIYASTLDGLKISENGGTSWTTALEGSAGDIEIASDGTVYVTFGVNSTGSIRKSVTDGATWTTITPASGALRIEMASAPSNPNVLYAVADGGPGSTDVAWFYKSEDAGSSWEEITIPLYLDQNCSQSSNHFTRGQAFFDLILGVHPEKPQKVVVGGIDLHASDDSGFTWRPVSYWTGSFCDAYVHADQHAMVFRPGYPNEAIFGNDGGVSYSNNIGNSNNPNFLQRVKGYNVTTFYAAAAANEEKSNYFLAGAQDNGTQQFSNAFLNNTREATGGDGGFCFIDEDDSDIQITSFVFNSYRVSQNGGKTFTSIADDQNRGRFINPSEYDSDTDILYGAGNTGELTRITNLSGTPSALQVINVSIDSRQITTIKASPHTENRLFVGVRVNGGEGKIFIIDNANSGSPTSTEITGSYSGSHGEWVSSIDVGASDDQLLATFSNYGINSVYETTNGGTNWTNKEGDLPDMPIRWGVYNPDDRSQVFLATELGVWSTNDLSAGPDWEPTNMGLANVRTDMLKIRPVDKLLVAATYGRGLYTSDILNSAASADFSAPRVGYAGQPVQFKDASSNANDDWSWTFGDAGTSTDQNPSHTYAAPGTYTVSLGVDSDADVETKSNFITILPSLTPPFAPEDGGDFESNPNYFTSLAEANGVNKWERGAPGFNLNSAPSGTNVWKTDLDAAIGDAGFDFSSALYTPSFDLTEPGNYSLKFNLEMEIVYCNAPSALQVQYTLDNGESWTTLGSSYPAFGVSNWYNRGDNTGCSIEFDLFPEKIGWTINTDGPLQVEHTLNSLVGNDAIAFRLLYAQSTGSQPNGSGIDPYDQDGILIDDFEITYGNPTADFSVQKIGFVGGDIDFKYESNGATSFDWDFGDGSGTSSDENPTYSFSTPGTYEVSLTITSASGPDDTKTNSIIILPSLPIPFEKNDGGNLEVNPNYFAVDNIAGTPFELGNSSVSGKNGTNSGSNAWVTGLEDDEYVDDSEAYLYTPVFDFLSLGNYELSFFANFSFEDNWDGFIVQYSTDLGESWEKLNPVEEDGWYNQISDPQSVFGASVPIFSGSTSGFEEFSTDLSFLGGNEYVSFRFQFLTDGATTDVGMALDDITVDGPEPGPGVPDFSYTNGSGCAGQVITFTNESTGSISSFEWDFGNNASPATATGPGPHNVTYSGNGTSTVTLSITSPVNGEQEEEKVDIIETGALHEPTIESTFNNNGTYTLEASLGDAYQWLRDGEIIEGETNRTISVDVGDGGEFSVLVTVGSCEVEAESLIVNSVLENSLAIYPNPVRDILRLESGLSINGDFRIYSQSGSIVMNGSLDESKTSIDVSRLQDGIYVLRLDANDETVVRRVIIRK
ncbi:MAG: PKD domain-containing protein [Ekhidna sp.]|uniref:PKD domain-containing protein n=1 Tax=Ekhidna sp. TaxID=2608089 RepID=UPI0032EF5E16